MTERRETSLGLQDNTELLHRISARLSDRLAGIFAAETVDGRPDQSCSESGGRFQST
ncbi:MAG: phosphatase [Arthrobacter sp.]|nr:phosphatase [Arthrobacter sp.]